MFRPAVLVAAMILAGAATASVSAGGPVGQVLAVEWDLTDSRVWHVDPVSGAGVLVGDSGFRELNSLARDAEGRFWSVEDEPDGHLVRIDVLTGRGTAVAEVDLGAAETSVRGLAFAPDGRLFATNRFPSGQLFVLDTRTGAGTPIGLIQSSVFPQGLAFSPTGELYGWSVERGLVLVDPATALVTDVNPDVGGAGPAIQTLFFDGAGQLRGAGFGIFDIDIGTGEFTLLGDEGGYYARGAEVIEPQCATDADCDALCDEGGGTCTADALCACPMPVPTLGEWGLLTLAVLLLAAGALLFGRLRPGV